MKQRVTGVAFVLAFALTSLAFAKGPPVPDGCTFERGTTTCTEVVDTKHLGGFGEFTVVEDASCLGIASVVTITEYERVTSIIREYRGVSHVLYNQYNSVETVSTVTEFRLCGILTP